MDIGWQIAVLATGVINFLNQYNLVIGRKKRKMVTLSEKGPWRYPGMDWADRAFEWRKMKSFVIWGWPVARFSHQLCTLRALDFIYYQQFHSFYPLTLPLFQRKKTCCLLKSSLQAAVWIKSIPLLLHPCSLSMCFCLIHFNAPSFLHLSISLGKIWNPRLASQLTHLFVLVSFLFLNTSILWLTSTVSFLFLVLEIWRFPFHYFIKSTLLWTL